ncbi:MAG: hypothetical protein R6U67_07000 [Sodalinema sp.]|uniref:hypothetical protein n=1 Tax=Sodalinema sp. TaxID=3080550 RepID=UPI00122BAC9E|nr:MAG: hypothetical protein EYR95_08260 [Phormidium sp. SL48-SHIP]
MYNSTITATQNHLPTSRLGRKRLGAYLLEAGLITPAQIQVAAYDQQVTGKKFSEVIVDRGWIKQQTIDFLIERVIKPEQQRRRSAGALAQPVEPFEQIYARRQHELHQGATGPEEEVPWTVD